MVEFISENTEKRELEIPEEPELSSQKPLEEMVEEQIEELQSVQNSQSYVDEPSVASGEYHQPEHAELKITTELKHELKPLVYDENEQIIVVDIFEKYGQKEDKWWKQNTKY